MMFRINTLLYVFFLLTINIASAQFFQIVEGPISNTPSDSRSVNFFDINNDGWEDIYISNGLSGGQQDLLYLNTGNGQFTQVTDMEIVTASNPSDGASFADYNNDGYIDGLVSSWYGAEDLLYLNNENGELNYNSQAGIVSGSFAETATFGDYNNDGWLDLYITNSGGNKKNYLYKNLQGDAFERITDHVLVNETKLSRGAIWGHFNNDEHLDLFVANEESTANDLFLGLGDGEFGKQTTGAIATSQKSSMTNSWGDIDNDCDMDLFIGNSNYFSAQQNQIFINQGSGFEAITNDPVVNSNQCSFGSTFGDYDNDGDLDLIVTNGFCSSGMENALYENQGDGTFVDVSDSLPSNSNTCSFGVAWGDVNNDGFLDLMIANCKNNTAGAEQANTLYLNQTNNNHWLKINLQGVVSNRDAIGARVKLKTVIAGAEVWQLRVVSAQSGYAGQNSRILHFGLGDATQIDSLVIAWPAGGEQVLEDLEVDQLLSIVEELPNPTTEISFTKNIQFQVFPNPVTSTDSSIQIAIESKIAFLNAKAVLYNSLGQLMHEKEVDIVPGLINVEIPILKKLPIGLYQMTLQLEEVSLTRSLIVQ